MIKWYGYICWCELSITFNRWNWWWRRASLAHCIKKDEAEIRFAMICHDYSIALQIINDYLKWMCVRTLFLLCSFANYIRNFLMNIFFLFSFATHTIVWTQLFYSACIAKLEIWFDDLFFNKKKIYWASFKTPRRIIRLALHSLRFLWIVFKSASIIIIHERIAMAFENFNNVNIRKYWFNWITNRKKSFTSQNYKFQKRKK